MYLHIQNEKAWRGKPALNVRLDFECRRDPSWPKGSVRIWTEMFLSHVLAETATGRTGCLFLFAPHGIGHRCMANRQLVKSVTQVKHRQAVPDNWNHDPRPVTVVGRPLGGVEECQGSYAGASPVGTTSLLAKPTLHDANHGDVSFLTSFRFGGVQRNKKPARNTNLPYAGTGVSCNFASSARIIIAQWSCEFPVWIAQKEWAGVMRRLGFYADDERRYCDFGLFFVSVGIPGGTRDDNAALQLNVVTSSMAGPFLV